MRDDEKPVVCEGCRVRMKRDLRAEGVNIGDRDYSHPIHSDALAISPLQIEEHKRHFPDIKIDSEGRPIFDNYRKHEEYLNKTGTQKLRQRKKRRGRKVETRTKKRPA
jgi:hypothetical protein